MSGLKVKKNTSNKSNNMVNITDFKSERLIINTHQNNDVFGQKFFFPKYLYDSSKPPTTENLENYAKTPILICEPFKMIKTGEVSMERAYHFMPKIDSYSIFEKVREIDEYMSKEISKTPSAHKFEKSCN